VLGICVHNGLPGSLFRKYRSAVSDGCAAGCVGEDPLRLLRRMVDESQMSSCWRVSRVQGTGTEEAFGEAPACCGRADEADAVLLQG
jgi:hypothetical protein